MMHDGATVVIAGGGIGGLACALALSRFGMKSLVLEQAPAFGEVGVGLQVAPNAMAVLEALGVEEARQDSLRITGVKLIDAVSGETITAISCGSAFQERFGNPYAVAHRADIHGALLRACRQSTRIELRTDSAVVDHEAGASGVLVRLASGEVIAADALVGADGISSRIRAGIVGGEGPLRDAGMIYRALIPSQDMPSEEQKPFTTIWAGPGQHIIYYPIRDRSAFNFAAVVTGPDQTDAAPGDVSRADVLEAVAPSHQALRALLAVPESYRKYAIRYRDPVDNWTAGPVTLLGDAAHPMVHYLAQGAAMALEDAICLARVVAEANGDYNAAFRRYQEIRIPRSARVQLSALMLDEVLHAGGVERLVRNSIFAGRTDEEHYQRFSWLYTSPWYVRQ